MSFLIHLRGSICLRAVQATYRPREVMLDSGGGAGLGSPAKLLTDGERERERERGAPR